MHISGAQSSTGRGLRAADESKRKTGSRSVSHTQLLPVICRSPGRWERCTRAHRSLLEGNVLVTRFSLLFQLPGGTSVSFPPLSQRDPSSLCSVRPLHPPGCILWGAGGSRAPPPAPSSSYGCQTPSSLSLLFEAFLLRESPPHRANPVESKTCLAKTFLETACAHAPLHQCHYGFSSDQRQPRRCCQARKV